MEAIYGKFELNGFIFSINRMTSHFNILFNRYCVGSKEQTF